MAQQIDQQLQALTTAVNGFTTAYNTANPRTATTTVSPYEGEALNWNKRNDVTIYNSATEPLPNKFDGQPANAPRFIDDVLNRAATCQWSVGNHAITTFTQGTTNLNLFKNWGRIEMATVIQAKTTRDADANGLRRRQNADMMYHTIYKSLEGQALISVMSAATPVATDGPILFLTAIHNTYPNIVSQALNKREELILMHPKQCSFDIKTITNNLRVSFNIIDASSKHGMSETDKLFYAKRVLSMIQTPIEFASEVALQVSKAGDDPNYKVETLFTKAESKEAELKQPTVDKWKPSDKTPNEQLLAMLSATVADAKPTAKTGNNRRPPFAKSEGKPGDTKTWNGKTWYYCPTAHRNGHWVTHPPEKCKAKDFKDNGTQNKQGPSTRSTTANSSTADTPDDNNKTVKVDVDTLKQAFTALIEQPPTDADHAVNALMALLQQE